VTLIALKNAELAFGLTPLLDGASLAMQAGDRIGLIGRNGTGKSSLLSALVGTLPLDAGEVQRKPGLVIASVEQEPVLPPAETLRESLVLRGDFANMHDERQLWAREARLNEFLQRFSVNPDSAPASVSGGERKRAALALAFAMAPDLMLLDEPTNHLDVEGIETLEGLLQRNVTCVVITHDRRFLDQVANSIAELDRGILRTFPGNYSVYEERKAEINVAEDLAHRRFEKFWAQEEVWIRKGVEARRTRNEGRVKRLEHLREERAARRERIGQIKLTVDTGERSGKLVAELENVGKSFGGRAILDDVSLRVMRGDRVGLLGPNGAGKTTMIKLIVGALEPDSGRVRRGTNLQVAYFDQLRDQLDPERTLAETVSPGSDWVQIGENRKHISSYLQEFLFDSRRANAPIRMLSGGERNRLLLARLFARPANMLVLDEPTNDLDIDSLELLETMLVDYTGTLLLVSHDRAFLDNVVTSLLVLEGNGRVQDFVGGYSDWERWRDESRRAPPVQPSAAGRAAPPAPSLAPPKRKLSYKDQRELAALPAQLEALEARKTALTAETLDPGFYSQPHAAVAAKLQQIAAVDAEIEVAFNRWTELENA
jgi:ATP-binding cassette subfamily F protein uup